VGRLLIYKGIGNDAKRSCNVHGNKPCSSPRALHGCIGGISCKDFSKNRHMGEKCSESVICLASSSPGKSSDCMHGFVGLLDTAPPDWFVLENSDELAENEQHQESLNLFCYGVCARGYDVRVFTVNASEDLLSQSRKRTYIIGIMRPLRYFELNDYTAFFQTVEKLIKSFMCKALPLASVLYDESDLAVQRELQARQQMPRTNVMTTKEMNDQRQAWKSLGLRNIPGCLKVLQEDRDSPWFPTMTLRRRSSLEILQHKGRAKVEACEKKLQQCLRDPSGSSADLAAHMAWSVTCLNPII